MDPTKLVIPPDAYNAWLLKNVIEATVPRGETPEEAHIRAGGIIEMFKCFAPRDAVEAAIASHCVHLQIILQGAMRDAASTDLDVKTLKGMRASAMTISRTLHLWVTKLETMKSRNDKLAAETAQTAGPEQPTHQRAAEQPRQPVADAGEPEPPDMPPRASPIPTSRVPMRHPATPPSHDPSRQPALAAASRAEPVHPGGAPPPRVLA